MNEFLETSIERLTIEQYPIINEIKKYISGTKVRVYKSLTLEGDLSLDWNEENKGYHAIFIENDLDVKGNISNFGHGGVALHVLGVTHAINVISTGSLMFFSSLHIENILLGAYSEGLLNTLNLSTRLLLNDDHTIIIRGERDISFCIDKDMLSSQEKENLTGYFIKNKLLENFIYHDDEEHFLDFSTMVNPIFFNGKEEEIIKEIGNYLVAVKV